MAVRDDRSDVKQTTAGFRGPLMVQSLTSAKSKFLSLIKAATRGLYTRTQWREKMSGINSKYFVVLLLATLLVGCATAPEKLGTTYVSPLQYKDYTCDQIGMEMQRVSRKVAELRGTLDKDASNDEVVMGIGLILFWPALFFLEGGDGAQEAQYSRLKGEFEALEQVAIQKNCNIKVQTD